jgi:hypothetical protein
MSFYMMEIHQKLAAVRRPGVTLSEIFHKETKGLHFP